MNVGELRSGVVEIANTDNRRLEFPTSLSSVIESKRLTKQEVLGAAFNSRSGCLGGQRGLA